jgi:hypothetical protein
MALPLAVIAPAVTLAPIANAARLISPMFL